MSPHRYRKRPVEIEAAHLKPDNADRIAEWCGGWTEERGGQPGPVVLIKTLEGTMRADQGDYVIRGVQGEFFRASPTSSRRPTSLLMHPHRSNRMAPDSTVHGHP